MRSGETIAAADPERCLNLAGLDLPGGNDRMDSPQPFDHHQRHRADARRGRVGQAVVALFGPTNPLSTGPYGQPGNVLQHTSLPCVPCMKQECFYREPLACLRSITPLAVFERAIPASGIPCVKLMPLPYKISTLLYCFNRRDQALLVAPRARAEPRPVESLRRQAADGRWRVPLRLRLPRGGEEIDLTLRPAICISRGSSASTATRARRIG